MKIIKPSYEILSELDGSKILKGIETAGRVCYKSESKTTDNSAESFVKSRIKSGHESILEHEKITVRFICDRGVSHEIVRHRIASFSQESTRFCNYSDDKFGNELTFILPPWVDDIQLGYHSSIAICEQYESIPVGQKFTDGEDCEIVFLVSLANAEISYNNLLMLKWTPQQARSVLPNSLKTEIIVTANIREWRTIFKQRTASGAHPQMRELMCPLLDELKTIIPVVFDDITY